MSEANGEQEAESRDSSAETCGSISLELHSVPSNNGPPPTRGRPSLSSRYGKKKFSSLWKVMEVLLLSATVLGLLGVCMIPTVFFVKPPLEFKPVSLYLTLDLQYFASST
jgi:hypothetical protein